MCLICIFITFTFHVIFIFLVICLPYNFDLCCFLFSLLLFAPLFLLSGILLGYLSIFSVIYFISLLPFWVDLFALFLRSCSRYCYTHIWTFTVYLELRFDHFKQNVYATVSYYICSTLKSHLKCIAFFQQLCIF